MFTLGAFELSERIGKGGQAEVWAGVHRDQHTPVAVKVITRADQPGAALHEAIRNAATVLAYPSLYEGFGMPVIEAQACGTPVLTANTSSLPEAAGEAALMADPYDVGALAEGPNRLLTEKPLQHDLRQRGLTHASQFTWPRTARETAGVYLRALTEGKET